MADKLINSTTTTVPLRNKADIVAEDAAKLARVQAEATPTQMQQAMALAFLVKQAVMLRRRLNDASVRNDGDFSTLFPENYAANAVEIIAALDVFLKVATGNDPAVPTKE